MNNFKIFSLIKIILKDFSEFTEFLIYYFRRKIFLFSQGFEKNKNLLVKIFLMKRGRYNRPFLHLSTMAVLGSGILIAPYLAETYPIFASEATASLNLTQAQTKQSIFAEEDIFQTNISDKPRDKVITYKIEKGDTIGTIARKFNISVDTIRWENGLHTDNLSIGDELRILPVTGVAHKVQRGETVYSIAKKYDTDPQTIVDFPFNEFANTETFSLVDGQIVIVPDGIKPDEKPTAPRRSRFIAQGQGVVSSSGFSWPLPGGSISQYASWYHMALDIAAPLGVPVYAAQTGRVKSVSIGTYDGGYGTNLYITDDAGTETHYAHLSSISVSVGDNVIAGKTPIGLNGSTGRSTGPHVHFELRKNGVLVDPLSYLQ